MSKPSQTEKDTPQKAVASDALFASCVDVGNCPRPTVLAAPYHHFYWDCDRDTERMDKIHGPGGNGHDDPMSEYGAVECKTCGLKALVRSDSDDFPEI